VGVVIHLVQRADCLHMVQLMPLHPKTPSSLALFKSRLVVLFWFRLTQLVLAKRPLNRCSSSKETVPNGVIIYNLEQPKQQWIQAMQRKAKLKIN